MDDDEDAGELTARILERRGHRATRVNGRAAAQEVLIRSRGGFGLVVVDSVAGPSESVALVRELRTTSGCRETPVVVLARVERDRAAAWQAGADAFLVRPFHVEEFEGVVADVLTRSPQEREAHRARELAAAD